MRQSNLFLKFTTLIILLPASSLSMASGFAVNEHSAPGLGRSNAGDAAAADGVWTIASNPAGLTASKSLAWCLM